MAANVSSDKVPGLALGSACKRGDRRILPAAAQPSQPPWVQIGSPSALEEREEVSTSDTVRAAAQPGREHPARVRATSSLARIARAETLRVRTRDALQGWLSDPELPVRMGAIHALAEHGDPMSAWALARLYNTGPASGLPSRELLNRITKMERHNAALREKIEEINRKMNAAADKK